MRNRLTFTPAERREELASVLKSICPSVAADEAALVKASYEAADELVASPFWESPSKSAIERELKAKYLLNEGVRIRNHRLQAAGAWLGIY